MNLARIWRHVWQTRLGLRRRFPDSTLSAIEAAVHSGERGHDGEVRFAVEAELEWSELLADLSPRERSLEVFSHLRVWDTERNNGVLIFVLLADHAVEIVADRGFNGRVDPLEWRGLCDALLQRYAAGDYKAGSVDCIEAVHRLISRHFPATGEGRNELPNRPVVL